jgi:hypothetical protein
LELILLKDSGIYSAAARQNLFKTAQTSRGNGLRNLWLRWSGKEMSETTTMTIREVAHYDCTGTLGFICVVVFIWADSTIRGFAISLVTLAMLALFSAELVCLDLVL